MSRCCGYDNTPWMGGPGDVVDAAASLAKMVAVSTTLSSTMCCQQLMVQGEVALRLEVATAQYWWAAAVQQMSGQRLAVLV